MDTWDADGDKAWYSALAKKIHKGTKKMGKETKKTEKDSKKILTDPLEAGKNKTRGQARKIPPGVKNR
jgi:hypothetical protein